MGAWGYRTFENDTAADWVLDLESTDDLTLVLAAIDEVISTGEGYLDQDVACRALAACEVLTRLRRDTGDSLPTIEGVDSWVVQHPTHVSPELLLRAASAIKRILAPSSELRELWDEVGSQDWESEVRSLLDRVEM